MDRKIIQSTKWSGITEILSKLITPVINLFLARILTPEVFGIVATFTMITTFAEILTDAGFSKFLVQHEYSDADDHELSAQTAFWSNVVFSCFIWGAVCLFRYPIASLVGSSGYENEIVVMSFVIPIVSIASIQLALYRRNFLFRKLLSIRIVTCIVPLAITLPLAIALRNSWALIIGTIAKDTTNLVMLMLRSDWKPKLRFSFKKLKEMLSFSIIIMVDNFMIWLTSYAGVIVTTGILSDHYIGLFKTGVSTIAPYINLVYGITAPVLFSALSRLQDDERECKKVYYQFQHYTSLLALPLGVGIFAFRDFVTDILLGQQWREASMLLGGMGLALAITMITAQFNSDYFRAKGKPLLSLAIQGFYAIILIVSLRIAVNMSFEKLCISRIFATLSYAIVSCLAMQLFMNVPVLNVIKNILWPSVAAFLMGIMGSYFANMQMGFAWNVIFVIICILLYFILLLLIPSTRRDMLSFPFVKMYLDKYNKV